MEIVVEGCIDNFTELVRQYRKNKKKEYHEAVPDLFCFAKVKPAFYLLPNSQKAFVHEQEVKVILLQRQSQ